MCIRDSGGSDGALGIADETKLVGLREAEGKTGLGGLVQACLLYTSDAADERSSVDLGGRRIIKKKKKIE